MVVTNSLFEHKHHHKTTWQHPRSKHWHLLDYILVNSAFRRIVKDTRVMRSADCSSDHRLVRSRLVIEEKARRGPWKRRYDKIPARLDVRHFDVPCRKV
eukprot:1109671-Amorphochlora_amoeboformis.AAC.1